MLLRNTRPEQLVIAHKLIEVLKLLHRRRRCANVEGSMRGSLRLKISQRRHASLGMRVM